MEFEIASIKEKVSFRWRRLYWGYRLKDNFLVQAALCRRLVPGFVNYANYKRLAVLFILNKHPTIRLKLFFLNHL